MTLIDLATANAVQELHGGAPLRLGRIGGQHDRRHRRAGRHAPGSSAPWPTTRSAAPTARTCGPPGVEFEPHYSESAAGDGLGTGRCVVLITERRRPHHGDVSGGGLHAVARGRARVLRRAGRRSCCSRATSGTCRRPRRPCATPPPPPTRRTGRSRSRLSDPFCVSRHQREFLDLLVDDVDILLGNEEEITMLFGASSPEAAVAAAEETGLLVVMTRGALGRHRADRPGPRRGAGGRGRPRGRHDRRGRPVRGGLPLRPDPRHGPGGEHAARRPVRRRGDLAHGRAARGRPQGAGRRRRPAGG